MLSIMISIVFLIGAHLVNFEVGCETVGLTQELDPPDNKNSSIKYHVYSSRSPKVACFLEQNEDALKNCPVDPRTLTIFLIHGYLTQLAPGNLFEVIKDLIFKKGSSTIIIVDWTKYNGPIYKEAVKNAIVVGEKVADLIKYLTENSGISADNVMIVGHSLGAHLAGVIGKHIHGLYRIDGLDPAGPHFEKDSITRLSHTDATFVQAIHTSNEIYGLGLKEAIAHLDFYVNGGDEQPHCHYGAQYYTSDGEIKIVDSTVSKGSCHHNMVLAYYAYSINGTDCKFIGTNCQNYALFKKGKCTLATFAVSSVMGFYSQPILGLPERSKFFLRTSKDPPYCLKDGFTPIRVK